MRQLKNLVKRILRKCDALKVRYLESTKKQYSLDEAYNLWIEQFDLLGDQDIARLRSELTQKTAPSVRITLVVSLKECTFSELVKTIASLRNQIYSHWKLLAVYDDEVDPRLLKQIQKIERKYSQIELLLVPGISSIEDLWNAAVRSERESDYFIFLQSSDQLAPTALYYIAGAAQEQHFPKLIYTDEDEVDDKGLRLNHFFKPDLNEVMMLAFNVIGHAVAYKKSALEQMSGFRYDNPEIALYDINLRMIENHLDNQTVHIPRVLFHAKHTGKKDKADHQLCELQKKIVSKYLERNNLKGDVEIIQDNPYLTRVRLNLPDSPPLVSILMPMRDKVSLTRQCIDSILNKSTYQNYEIIIIDNGSIEPESLEYLTRIESDRITVLKESSPFNFAALNNRAAAVAQGQVLCLLNNDIEISTPNWLEEMLSFALQPNVGCVGAKLWYPDGRLQHGGVIWGIGDVAGHAHKFSEKGFAGYHHRLIVHQSILAVTGACLMVRKDIWDQVGGLNEELAVAFNDVDFCLKVWDAGYQNIWTPYAEMIHYESVSRGSDSNPHTFERYQKEVEIIKGNWSLKVPKDSFYNPNLSSELENFRLKNK
jgi:O-antigen biosynthesis protein